MINRSIKMATLLLGCALIFVACATDEGGDEVTTTTATDGNGDEPVTTTTDAGTTSTMGDDSAEAVEVSFAELPIAAKVPFYIAERDGLFEEHGVVVDTSFAGGGAEIIPSIISGDLDGGHANAASLIFAHVQGAELVCVTSSDSAKTSPPDTGTVLVTPDSDIQSIEDLSGRTVGVNNVESLMWVYAYGLLTDNGVDPESVNFVEVPFPSMGDALQQGQVDAVLQVEPFGTIYQQEEIAVALSPLYMPVIEGADLGCQTFSRQFVEENPEATAGFANAYDAAKEWAAENEQGARDAIVEWIEMDPELASSVVLSDWHPGVDVASLQAFADLMFDFGLLESPVDVTEFVWEDAVVFER